MTDEPGQSHPGRGVIEDAFELPRGEPFEFEQDDDELVQVNHLVPKSVRDTAQENSSHGELSNAVRMAYRIVAFGEEFSGANRLEIELGKVRSEKERLEDELADYEDELAELEQREAELEERVEESRTRDEKFEEYIEELESLLTRGEAVFEEHAAVQTASKLRGLEPAEIINRLQERNPELPEAAFKDQRHVDEPWRETVERREPHEGGQDG